MASADSGKRLFLLDGHALAYRAYYATMKTPMTNSRGQATGAVLGFINMVLRIRQEYTPSHLAVMFDTPKPTFRHQMYEAYKANREEMPEDLRSQLPIIVDAVDVLNIPRLSKEGFEADDLLAWVARRAAEQGYRVWLVTKDKDLMQLVDDNVHLLAPESGDLIDMGPAQVFDKMGVRPDQVRDLLALMGDASDNVPGVAGVGPKTAVKLLEKAGSLDKLLADVTVLGNPKLQEKINAARDDIELSRRLVTLDVDPGIELDVETLRARAVKRDECARMFTDLEFSSLLRNPLFDTKQAMEVAVRVPRTVGELEELVRDARAAGVLSVDTETTSTEPRQARLVGISAAVDPQHAWYIPVGHEIEPGRNLDREQVLAALRPLLEDPAVAKVGQNLKYDIQVFRGHGVELRGVAFDSMVAAYVIDPGRRAYGLEDLAGQYLQLSVTPIESLIGKRGKDQKTFAQTAIDEAAKYSGEDALLPLRLRDVFEPMLLERKLTALLADIEMPLVEVLAGMEWEGVQIDTTLLSQLSARYASELNTISNDIYGLAGELFNLNSPKQISEILYSKLQLSKGKRTKTGMSTDVDALEKLADEHPIAQRILDYRELQKLLSTYIDALPGRISQLSGRVHTSFNQTIAATGRLSSTDPNLQNIPVRTEAGAKIREAFVATQGHVLVSADYSQIELRLLAHLSADTFLRQAFEEDKDIHTQTASAMYGVFPEMVTVEMRRSAKTINFGLMYGMGPINLSRQLKISFREAQEFIDSYFRQFPAIHAFMERCVAEARAKGYSETVLGRRRYLPDINSERRQVREAAERTAINTPVQGSAADIIKMAMIDIHRTLPATFPGARMVLQVHDELVFEVASESAERLRAWVVERMCGAYALSVPLRVDAGVGRTWREAH